MDWIITWCRLCAILIMAAIGIGALAGAGFMAWQEYGWWSIPGAVFGFSAIIGFLTLSD